MLRKQCLALVLCLAGASLAALAQRAERLAGPPIVIDRNQELIGGPFVVNVGPRAATIGWVLKTGVELERAADEQALSKMARAEHVTYGNLQPGTAYYYEFEGAERVRGRFRTPPSGNAKFEFLAYGDTRTRHDVHRQVVEAMVRFDPDFVLHTGDLVNRGTETQDWPFFFSAEAELLRKTAFFPALGNHEQYSPQYFNFLRARPYYSFTWGLAHFIVLNSDIGNVPGNKEEKQRYWEAQKEWLEHDLAIQRKPGLTFVSFHHPPYTAINRRSTNERMLELLPLFEKHKVAAVFNGHDHNYHRYVINGVQFVTTGGGGAPLYPVDAPLPGMTVKAESIEHFVHVQVDGGKAVLRALALDGREIDRLEVGR